MTAKRAAWTVGVALALGLVAVGLRERTHPPAPAVAQRSTGLPRLLSPSAGNAPPAIPEAPEPPPADAVVLSGRVLDASGGPIPNARLHAGVEGPSNALVALLSAPAPGAVLYQTRADAHGFYRFPLPRGRHVVVATAGGYAPTNAWIELTGPQTRDFCLVPAATLAGRVVRRGTGEPIAGARVRAEAGRASSEADSDATGAFALDGLEPGRYQLTAAAGPLAGRLTLPVIAHLATRVEGVIIEVDRARTVDGRVQHKDGAPVAGAQVDLWSRDRQRGQTTSDGRGRFHFQGVLADSYRLEARAHGLTSASARVTVADQDVGGIALVMEGTAAVHGRVLDDRDQPLEGVMIEAEIEDDDDTVLGRPARSAADGSFTLEELPPGDVVVRAQGGARGRTRLELGHLTAGERREITLRLSSAGVHISGHARWRDGRPAASVAIAANNMRADDDRVRTTTDRDGSFRVGPFPRGALVALEASSDGGRPFQPENGRRAVRLEASDVADVDFVFTAATREQIRGTVVGPDGPLGGAVVRASGVRAVTEQDGSFVLEGLDAGPHDLHADYPGLPSGLLAGVASGRTDVRLTLVRGAVLAGTVEGMSGRSAGLCTVWAQRRASRGGPDDQAICAETGTFELRGLAPGEYDLLATTLDGRSGGLAHLSVRAGEERRDLRVHLGGGVAVVGRVVDLESRRPLASAQLRATVDGNVTDAVSDEAGRFELASRTRGLSVLLEITAADHEAGALERRPGPDVDRVEVGDVPLLARRQGPSPVGRTGIVLGSSPDGGFFVIDTVAELPAAKAGIRAGDLILGIDGHDLTNANLGAAVALIRGEPGTALILEVKRPDGAARRVRLVRV